MRVSMEGARLVAVSLIPESKVLWPEAVIEVVEDEPWERCPYCNRMFGRDLPMEDQDYHIVHCDEGPQ